MPATDPHDKAPTTWRAPLCRRPDEHPEVEHNWESLGRLGKVCSCDCHTGVDLRGSSLDPAHLYVECEPCRLAGRGGRIARDPFNDDECVYGHPLNSGSSSQD